MFFTLVQQRAEIAVGVAPHGYLIHNTGWNDWFKYQTSFVLVVVDATGLKHELGTVKIGQAGLLPGDAGAPGTRIPQVPTTFEVLPEAYFSIGQGETYYETLNTLPADLRYAVLLGLRDCAYDLGRFDAMANEYVMRESLLRSVDAGTVRRRLHRLAHGNAELTPFSFEFTTQNSIAVGLPVDGSAAIAVPIGMTLRFDVAPESSPPTNVHVLIGRNGVGKTRCLKGIASAVLGGQDVASLVGTLQHTDAAEHAEFAGLVFVSFSAFDDFDLPPVVRSGLRAKRVGLRYHDDATGEVRICTPEQLAADFADSFGNCRAGLRAERLRQALSTLENDTLFAEADVASLLALGDDDWEAACVTLFRRLSSGHAIVLLTITRLVELVDERTLVLLDEPESHLHPPLLSAFVRALTDLLVRRNGVGLIATHSPVVLQEVPARCAWMLNRTGRVASAERPPVETFGENVSVLTREVFRLELTTTGFYRLIGQAVDTLHGYEEVLAKFGGQVGAEGRALTRALVLERDQSGDGS